MTYVTFDGDFFLLIDELAEASSQSAECIEDMIDKGLIGVDDDDEYISTDARDILSKIKLAFGLKKAGLGIKQIRNFIIGYNHLQFEELDGMAGDDLASKALELMKSDSSNS